MHSRTGLGYVRVREAEVVETSLRVLHGVRVYTSLAGSHTKAGELYVSVP